MIHKRLIYEEGRLSPRWDLQTAVNSPRVPSPALHKVLTRDKSDRAVTAAEKMTPADGETSSGGAGFSSSACTRWKPDPGQLVPASQQGSGCPWLVPRTGRELLPGDATATASLPRGCSDNRSPRR